MFTPLSMCGLWDGCSTWFSGDAQVIFFSDVAAMVLFLNKEESQEEEESLKIAGVFKAILNKMSD